MVLTERQKETATSQPHQFVGGPALAKARKAKGPTLTKRVNHQGVALEIMMQEFMKQFKELHRKLNNLVAQSGVTTSSAPPPPPLRVAPKKLKEGQREVRVEEHGDVAIEPNVTANPLARENPLRNNVGGSKWAEVQNDLEHVAELQAIKIVPPTGVKMRTKVAVNKDDVDRKAMADFYQLDPLAFEGGDGLAAEKWITIMNKKFSFLNSTDNQKVRFATFWLEGDADLWWEAESGALESKGEKVT